MKLSLHNYKDIFYFCCKSWLNVKRAFTLSIYFCKHLSISGFWGAGLQRQNYDAEASTWAKGVTGQFTSTDSIKHGCQKYEANAGGHADGHSSCCKSLMVVWKPKKWKNTWPLEALSSWAYKLSSIFWVILNNIFESLFSKSWWYHYNYYNCSISSQVVNEFFANNIVTPVDTFHCF